MTWLAHRDVAVMMPRQIEVAAIEKRLNARWANIERILPSANKDIVLEQTVTIASHCTDRAPQREIVKCLNVIATRLHQSAAAFNTLDALDSTELSALLTRVGANLQLGSVLKKIRDEARRRSSTINVERSVVSSKRQRARAAKEAAALAARSMLRQAYPERLITLALQVELSEILFEVATGCDATNMHNICALVNKRQ
jgi:hypothetical protein